MIGMRLGKQLAMTEAASVAVGLKLLLLTAVIAGSGGGVVSERVAATGQLPKLLLLPAVAPVNSLRATATAAAEGSCMTAECCVVTAGVTVVAPGPTGVAVTELW